MKSSSISTAISSSNTCFFLSAKSLNFLKATSIRSSEKSGYPKETNFLLDARKLGNLAENGKMMFIYQAHQAFSVWHKIFPVIDDEVIGIVEK